MRKRIGVRSPAYSLPCKLQAIQRIPMPKYFTAEIPLPFKKVAIGADEITIEMMERILQEHSSVSIAISLPGLEDSCIGYVINLTKTESEITVCDITKKVLFALETTAEVTQFAKHVIGYEFSQEIHERVQKFRDISW